MNLAEKRDSITDKLLLNFPKAKCLQTYKRTLLRNIIRFQEFSFFWKLPILKNIFNIPNINPVPTAVTKDFNNNFVKASLFEKSISNNPKTKIPAKSPAVIDKNVTLK